MSEHPTYGKPNGPNFLRRWSRRKRRAQQAVETRPLPAQAPTAPPAHIEELALPDIAALHEDSEVSMFFNEKVSDTLRRQALRKLFHMNKFNVCDGLDDYAEDYTCFEPLGEVTTAFQRLQTEREELARKLTDSEEVASAGQAGAEQSAIADASPEKTTTNESISPDDIDANGGNQHEV